MGLLLLVSVGVVSCGCRSGRWRWDRRVRSAAASDCDRGRQDSRRRSSRPIRPSAVRARTAMMSIAANTPLGLKLFCAVAITSPRPFWAPRNSPTIAPMIANPKATCRLAMIQVSAEGTTTWRVTCEPRGAQHPGVGEQVAVHLADALEGVEEHHEEHQHRGQRHLRARCPGPSATVNSEPEHDPRDRVRDLDVGAEHVGQEADLPEQDADHHAGRPRRRRSPSTRLLERGPDLQPDRAVAGCRAAPSRPAA